jgi:hypothetical protein
VTPARRLGAPATAPPAAPPCSRRAGPLVASLRSARASVTTGSVVRVDGGAVRGF